MSSGRTGHAESQDQLRSEHITYGRILQIYFSVAHDPTELDRQGPDAGTQYRSAIFTTGPAGGFAKAYIAQLDQAHAYDPRNRHRDRARSAFYPAEEYHQDFLTRHPSNPYIVYNDMPKLEELRRIFQNLSC